MPIAMETNVAMEYPKMPLSIEGMKKLLHCLATHIAAAVVGPPTAAFEASTNSLVLYLKNLLFPTRSTNNR